MDKYNYYYSWVCSVYYANGENVDNEFVRVAKAGETFVIAVNGGKKEEKAITDVYSISLPIMADGTPTQVLSEKELFNIYSVLPEVYDDGTCHFVRLATIYVDFTDGTKRKFFYRDNNEAESVLRNLVNKYRLTTYDSDFGEFYHYNWEA